MRRLHQIQHWHGVACHNYKNLASAGSHYRTFHRVGGITPGINAQGLRFIQRIMRLTLFIALIIVGVMLAYAKLMAMAAEPTLPGPYEYTNSIEKPVEMHLAPPPPAFITSQAN
jgi:hypothetical protein